MGRFGGFNAGFSLYNAGTGGFNGGAGGRDLRFRRFQRRAGAFSGRAIVIQLLSGDGASLRKGTGTDVAFSGGIELRLALLHHRFGGPHFALPLVE